MSERATGQERGGQRSWRRWDAACADQSFRGQRDEPMNETVRACAGASRMILALILMAFWGAAPRLSARQDQTGVDEKVELLHVQGNVYMIAGAGANITVQVGEEVVFLVDAGVPEMSDQVLDAVRSITEKRIMFIIDTSADADHIGGNANLAKAGIPVPNIGSTL